MQLKWVTFSKVFAFPGPCLLLWARGEKVLQPPKNSEMLFFSPSCSPLPNETEIKPQPTHNRLSDIPQISLLVLEHTGLRKLYLMAPPNSSFQKQTPSKKTGGSEALGKYGP